MVDVARVGPQLAGLPAGGDAKETHRQTRPAEVGFNSADVASDDLLCGAPEPLEKGCASSSCRRALVLLRMETASASESKRAAGVVYGFTLFAYAATILLVVLKTVYRKSLSLFDNTAYEQFNCVLAGVCFVLLGWTLWNFIFSVWGARCRGEVWRPRRKRVASLAVVAAIVQLINLAAWILPNAYVVAYFPACAFFGLFIDVCGVLRWTCWNLTLLLYLVTGSSLLIWEPKAGTAALRLGRRRAADAPLLKLDAPWWHALDKLPLWALQELSILAAVNFFRASTLHQLAISRRDRLPPYNCPQWGPDEQCTSSGWTRGGSVSLVFFIIVSFIVYLITIIRVYLQLSQQPYFLFRAANILFQLQLRSTLMVFKVLVISTAVLWFLFQSSCWSYFTTWLGIIPMQLVASALAWQNLYLFSPKDPGSSHILQAWLQEVAWTEAEEPECLAVRNARARGKEELDLLQREPMFCFETALKLIKWSGLTYTDVGQDSWRPSDNAQGAPEAVLVKGRLQAPASWPSSSEDTLTLGDSSLGRSSDCGTEGSASMRQSDDLATDWDEAGDSPTHSRMTSQEGASTSQGSGAGPAAVVVLSKRKRRRREEGRQMLAVAMRMYGLTDLETFWDPQLDTKALLGWSRTTVVLAFRGTHSLANALLDIKVWRTKHHSGSLLRRPPLVHAGFYQAWRLKGLDRQVLGHLQMLFETGMVEESAQVLVTGHSLGGALAMLAAYDIAVELKPHRLQVVTFGCPYIGDHAFARGYDDCVRDTWNIVHDRDVVVRAGKFWLLFKRPGHRVIIDLAGDMLVRPSALELQVRRGSKMQHHLLRTYRAALQSVLLAQFSNRAGRSCMTRVLSLSSCSALRDDLAKDGIDWQKLRRIARWGHVAALRTAAPRASGSRHRLLFFKRSGSHRTSRSHSHGPRETPISVAAVLQYRATLEESADSCAADGDGQLELVSQVAVTPSDEQV